MLPISDANHTMGAVLTVSMKKKKTQLAGGRCPQARKKKREEKQSKERGEKKQESVPVQSRAQLIQPVGVRRVTQFGQSVHSLHNDLQHVADLPQDPARLGTTQHWKRR